MKNRFTYLSNVVTLELNAERCVGCGMCEIVCPHAVLRMDSGRAAVVNRDGCMECGACATNCPAGAISVDAGVGCAAAVINSALGRTDAGCCCNVEPREKGSGDQDRKRPGTSSCC